MEPQFSRRRRQQLDLASAGSNASGCVEAFEADEPAAAPQAATDPDKEVPLKTAGLRLLATPPTASADFQSKLGATIAAYLGTSEALVKGDSKTAAATAARVKTLVDGIDATGIEGAAGEAWKLQAKTISESAAGVAAAADLKGQRDHLFVLSEAMYTAAWSFPHDKKPLFVQFCPMAHTDKGGAHWLSDKSGILNPYYGDAMLTCGEVRKVLR